jgi:hypothetical protein
VDEYVRVADFEADAEAVQALVKAISGESGPPEGVPATSITVLQSLDSNKVRVVIFFSSEEDLRQASKTLDGMNPPEDARMRRTSVDAFKLVLFRETP